MQLSLDLPRQRAGGLTPGPGLPGIAVPQPPVPGSTVLGSAPPLPEVAGKLPEPPPPDRLSNGAPRVVDSAVPLPLELEALEAVA